MHLKFQNVNDAFQTIVNAIHEGVITTSTKASRAGEVMVIEEPVVITYKEPTQRVLFNRSRDCNPFFHLFESLWMLAGREDVEPLARYNSKIADIASDDGLIFNGAYGNRWRNWRVPSEHKMAVIEERSPVDEPTGQTYRQINSWKTVDQLDVIVDQLKRKPESRRVVLEMWSVHSDLGRIDTSKDVCCNTHAYFLVENGTCPMCDGVDSAVLNENGIGGEVCRNCNGMPNDVPRYLNMTVCNRSNDLIWGALGANVVHFSFLQEYLAHRIGLEVGTYNQMTNNLHAYSERWVPDEWLDHTVISASRTDQRVYHSGLKSFPLVKDAAMFDKEVKLFIDNKDWTLNWHEPFLQLVATPLCWAYELHKRRDYNSALQAVESCMAEDWRISARYWLKKRKHNWEAKQ